MSADAPRWMNVTLVLAGLYNFAWGALVILFPAAIFRWCGMAPPNYPEIWQCLGMVVGLYGLAYLIAARNPLRHWPVILVGLAGKVLGPIGFLHAAIEGRLPWAFGWNNIANDLIWWIPFTLILLRAWRQREH